MYWSRKLFTDYNDNLLHGCDNKYLIHISLHRQPWHFIDYYKIYWTESVEHSAKDYDY